MATIATHNGSSFSQKHNRRDRSVTDKEAHIDKNGEYEVWLDTSLKDFYKKQFGNAQEEYNAKQTRNDRKIDDYYKYIENDKKKHVAYEMIVGVYDKNLDDKSKREILREFANTWSKRNPHLPMVGCYYHNDEEGEPHIHIDYVPVATNFERGMKVQNSLTRALKQQGIESGASIHETPQILWEKRENGYLEELCNAKGITIEHSDTYRGHESTSAYKNHKLNEENAKLKAENEKLKQDFNKLAQEFNKTVKEFKELKGELER